ncbi:MAG: hypothetical protein COW13_05125, partial [Candidatus Omnitrophica bacterium CG12_big_fil_rev_8_21_14_0_65_50_5]
DYLLKQLTSSLMYPEDEIGKKFWDAVYQKAYEKLGTIDIPLNTFNKVWIVPQQARVYQSGNVAYVAETRLKVLLEDDYAARANAVVEKSETVLDEEIKNTVRDVIVPVLEDEVNHGRHFMALRQIYHALILAKWYEKHFENSVLGQSYTDLNKTDGIEIENKEEKFQIWQQYVASFKTGLFDLIKEEYDPATQQIIPKKYFSGGMGMAAIEKVYDEAPLTADSDDLAQLAGAQQILIQSEFQKISDKAMMMSKIIYSLKLALFAVLLMVVPTQQQDLKQIEWIKAEKRINKILEIDMTPKDDRLQKIIATAYPNLFHQEFADSALFLLNNLPSLSLPDSVFSTEDSLRIITAYFSSYINSGIGE